MIALQIIGVYLVIGFLFSVLFVWKGLKKVDPSAEGSSFWFKMLLIPGMMVFWVIFFNRWLKQRKA